VLKRSNASAPKRELRRPTDDVKDQRHNGRRHCERLLISVVCRSAPRMQNEAANSIRRLAHGGCQRSGGTSASPCDTFEHPSREGHVRRAPDVSFLERPRVDRVPVPYQLKQA
jgi:hypothetical protein